MKRVFINLMSAFSSADIILIIKNGNVCVKKGKLKSELLSDLNDLVKIYKVESACIQARSQGHNYKFGFYGIPFNMQQSVRNIWMVNS